ncbi:MAG: Cif family virulence factor [Planctomycetota bacterium]|jgi:hypothetical protein
MKKAVFLTLTLLLCTLICGCQTGPSDEELIKTTMNSWKLAIVDKDVDAIMANYSEDFSSESGESRGETQLMFQYLISAGMLDNIDINFDIAQLTITDDTAEFTPVEILWDMGEMTLDFTLKKEEENTWRIIESDEQQ